MVNMKKYKMLNPDYRKSSREKGVTKINGRIYNFVGSYPVGSVAEKIADDIRRKDPGELVRVVPKKDKHNRAEYQVFSTAPKSLGAKLLSFVQR